MKKLGLRSRIRLMAAAFLLLTNIALGTLLMQQSRNAMRTLIDERVLDIVNTAADMLDGDALEWLQESDRETKEYQAVLDTLIYFRDNMNLEYIYCVRDMGNKSFTFGIDPDMVSPGDFGSPVAYTDALYLASQGTAAVDKEPYEDEWGRFISGYSPVFNSAGKVAGIVAVDFDAEWYEGKLNQNVLTIVISCLVFLAAALFIVMLLTRQFDQQMAAINGNLYDLAADIEDLTGKTRNELSGRIRQNSGSIQKMGEAVSVLRDDLRRYISHSGTQANSMITAMASDYRSVYHVNLDENDGVCYRGDPGDKEQSPEGVHFPFYERFCWYAAHVVTDMYREGFLQFIEPDNIRKSLETQPIIAYRYLARREGREYYEMIRMAGVRRPEDRDDHMVHAIGLGLTEIDAEVRESMSKNEALAEALTVAQEASKAKTAFLSNMSHEIRTPMNAIIGLSNLALNGKDLPPETRDYLEKIGGSARHLLGIINDILDMSRIESGRIVLKKEEFSLMAILEQINTMVMTQCQDKGLTYECRLISHVDDYYIGDDVKLKEVLINILSNAIKFTDAGGSVTLTVERTAVFEEQSTIKFCITDTGIGMDKDFIPHIFDAFSQEDASRKNRYGSTGLGMAITRSIVEMMNGTIQVESEKGRGSAFTVVITLKNCDRQSQKPNDMEKQRAPLEGRHILLAEDIDINAEIMMDILEMKDVKTDHAKNGRLALEMFEQSGEGFYDAILMDIRMPEMDGLEAAAAIRALPRLDARTIPIIALTANAFDEDAQRSLQAGMNAHLSKPVEPDHLFKTLEELIYEARTHEDAPQPGLDGEKGVTGKPV